MVDRPVCNLYADPDAADVGGTEVDPVPNARIDDVLWIKAGSLYCREVPTGDVM
jgi:hypothetical protein